ncbi:MAG: hypothetical protein WCS17_04985 [Prevotella sp.]
MTDNSSVYAGDYSSGQRYTCILDEGAYTPADTYDFTGRLVPGGSFATPIAIGDAVAISTDTAGTYAACRGLPLVTRPGNGTTLLIGKVVEVAVFGNYPSTAAQADTLAERLAGGYYRKAIVEFNFSTKLEAITVKCDGSNAVTQGDGSTLKYGITDSVAALAYHHGKIIYDVVASGGSGLIPLHYVPSGSSGDLYTCLVMYTGPTVSIT